jgi:zinc transporter
MLLPATLITGYFGMNTKALPFAENDYGTVFATVICIAASLGALLILWKMGLAGPDHPSASERSGRSPKRGP